MLRTIAGGRSLFSNKILPWCCIKGLMIWLSAPFQHWHSSPQVCAEEMDWPWMHSRDTRPQNMLAASGFALAPMRSRALPGVIADLTERKMKTSHGNWSLTVSLRVWWARIRAVWRTLEKSLTKDSQAVFVLTTQIRPRNTKPRCKLRQVRAEAAGQLSGRGAAESESTGKRAGGEGRKDKGKDMSPLPKRRLHEIRCPWGKFRCWQIFYF